MLTLFRGALEEGQRWPELEVRDRRPSQLRDTVVRVEQLFKPWIAQDKPVETHRALAWVRMGVRGCAGNSSSAFLRVMHAHSNDRGTWTIPYVYLMTLPF